MNNEITPYLFKDVFKNKFFKLIFSALFVYIPLTLFLLLIQHGSDLIVSLPLITSFPLIKNIVIVFSGLFSIIGAIRYGVLLN